MAGDAPPRDLETLDEQTKRRERLLLGLRLDEPVELARVDGAIDAEALERLIARGLVERVAGVAVDGDRRGSDGTFETGPAITLTRRGRLLGGAVTADLMTLD
jgi:coproporphyrinogen III oxidase-like Fe-S oxidoreductase